jgi:hypothetical protein
MGVFVRGLFFYDINKQGDNKMSSSSGSATIPTVTYTSDGLYGTAKAGKKNSFTATDFQKNLVNQTQEGINTYMNQLINPTYDSQVFKAQTKQRNQLANQSFENNLINPLTGRGLTRGSSVNQMGNNFAKTLADLETAAMATEDARNMNILSQLANYYQIPYSMMTGMQSLAQAQQSSNQQAYNQAAANQNGLMQSIIGGASQMGAAALMPGTNNYYGSAGGTGGAGGGAAYSDGRLKENVRLLDIVDGYPIYLFDYISGGKNQVGVIAQEILDKSPEAVGLSDDGYYCVDYDLLPETVIGAITEINGQLESKKGGVDYD